MAGRNGIPTLGTSAAPRGGANITLISSNSTGNPTPGLILVGIDPVAVDLLGGTFLVSPLVQTSILIPASGGAFRYAVPPGICQTFYLQVFQLDAAAVLGVSMTPGLRFTLGN